MCGFTGNYEWRDFCAFYAHLWGTRLKILSIEGSTGNFTNTLYVSLGFHNFVRLSPSFSLATQPPQDLPCVATTCLHPPATSSAAGNPPNHQLPPPLSLSLFFFFFLSLGDLRPEPTSAPSLTCAIGILGLQ